MSANDSKVAIPSELSHVLQASTLHLGIVRDLKDPEGRGRVKVECPTTNHTGRNNWMGWCEPLGLSVSTVNKEGDYGMWWPYVAGQAVVVGFKDGCYWQPYCFPGPAWAEEPENKEKAWIPKEAKKLTKESVRKGTRLRLIKSEAGHTVLMDDNGKQEALAIVDWTGAGIFMAAPGKEEDEQEKKDEESKYRKGELRGSRTVAAQTSPSVGEITDAGVALLAVLDLNGQGFLTLAKDGDGKIAVVASKEVDGAGPCLILDAKEDNAYLCAKDAQIHLMGEEGKIFVTKQMIVEAEPIDAEAFVKSIKDSLKNYFSKYDEDE